MARKKIQPSLFGFLADLEDREVGIKRRLRRLLKRIPERPGVGQHLSPLSVRIDAAHLSGMPNLALSLAEQSLDRDEHDAEAWLALAKSLAALNAIEPARKALARARRFGAEGPECDYLVACLSRDDRKALEHSLAACEAEPSYGEALFLCARLAAKMEWPQEGQAILEKVAPLMEHSPQKPAYDKFVGRAPNTSN